MTDDMVVLWRDHDPEHDVWYEIVQLGEGEFELRVICDGYLWLTEEGPAWRVLLDRADEIRNDLHVRGASPVSERAAIPSSSS